MAVSIFASVSEAIVSIFLLFFFFADRNDSTFDFLFRFFFTNMERKSEDLSGF